MIDHSRVWLLRHLQVLFDSLGRLWKTPAASSLTMLVIAIAIALPMILYQLSVSLGEVVSGWDKRAQISLFLKTSGDGEQGALDLGQLLLQKPAIEDVQYVSPEEGLEGFSETAGFSEVIESLPENPLPPVLVVFPAGDLPPVEIEQLAVVLEEMPEVDTAVYDQQWINRLSAIVSLIKQAAIILSVLMAAGITLVIGNTVRLGISSRASEIEIIDQVGGTRRFIRRPFLYLAALQATFGTIAAWLIANLVIWLMVDATSELAALYQSSFTVAYIGLEIITPVLLGVLALSLFASFATVYRHLVKLAPR